MSLPDLRIVDESDNKRTRRAIARFHPRNWNHDEIRNGRGRGLHAYRLLRIWQAACADAIEALLASNNTLDEILWSVGWYFGESIAVHQQDGPVHFLCINPIDEEGRPRYRLSERRSLKCLLASAKHETAHIGEPRHDEDFANILTGLDAHLDEASVLFRMHRAR